jgi:hypothetical protein
METGGGTSSPRPFGEIFSLWLKVFQMDEPFFAAERPRASNGNTLLALLIYAVAAVIFAFIQRQIGFRQLFLQRYLGGNSPNLDIPICLPLVALVAVPLGYYIGMGITHLVAKLFGGAGSFSSLAYLVSLFYVPLGIVSSLLSLIPCLGGLLALAAGIFSIVLMVRVIKVNYQLSTGKAVWVVLTPLLVILVLVILLSVVVVVILALLAPSVGNIFSNIINGLATPAP